MGSIPHHTTEHPAWPASSACSKKVPGGGAASLSRPLLTALVAAMLALVPVLLAEMSPGARAEVGVETAQKHRVGHAVKRTTVPGSAQGESRAIEVHVWYPADHQGLAETTKTKYRSELYGKPLEPRQCPPLPNGSPRPDRCQWDSISWWLEAELAREAPIDQSGKAAPVIVFSHGSVNDPIDYAYTLERLAGAGFVVAAPYHVNNTQDDVRKDFINTQVGYPLFACNDGRPWLPPPRGCSRGAAFNSSEVPFSMADRVSDISKVLDELPGWLGKERVDLERVGVLGHSRGTATALAAAGGSAPPGGSAPQIANANCQAGKELCWPLQAEKRVDAVMGMAIAARPITFGANVPKVEVPTLLVAGGQDETSVPKISEEAFDLVSNQEKALVTIGEAQHRSFDSTYCDQAQAAGAIAQDLNRQDKVNPRKILDTHTVRGIVNGGNSGRATQYCAPDTFTNPIDIHPLVASLMGAAGTSPASFPFRGVDTVEVKEGMTELASTFFGTVLKRTGNDGPHFTRYLAPKWLDKHESMVGDAEACVGDDGLLPPGQEEVPEQEASEVRC